LEFPPITLFRFDCVTNTFLAEQVREIIGNELTKDCLSSRVLRFDHTRENKPLSIKHYRQLDEKQIRRCLEGNIVIVGGSWDDAYEKPGSVFEETVLETLMRELHKEHSLVQYIGICFGWQTMANIIGKRYSMEHLRTEPGSLEFCPSPTRTDV